MYVISEGPIQVANKQQKAVKPNTLEGFKISDKSNYYSEMYHGHLSHECQIDRSNTRVLILPANEKGISKKIIDKGVDTGILYQTKKDLSSGKLSILKYELETDTDYMFKRYNPKAVKFARFVKKMFLKLAPEELKKSLTMSLKNGEWVKVIKK